MTFHSFPPHKWRIIRLSGGRGKEVMMSMKIFGFESPSGGAMPRRDTRITLAVAAGFSLRKLNVAATFAFFVFSVVSSYLNAQDMQSPLFRAMQDELQRTMEKLKLEKEKLPYYVAYRVIDKKIVNITARFGAIVEDESDRDRSLNIDLRVGDYEFDNSNFVPLPSYGFSFAPIEQLTKLPLDDDYDAIRHKIWLATDASYKEAIDVFSKKKSAIEHKAITEKIPDFSKSTPYKKIEEIKKLKLDRNYWRKNLKDISNLFRKYPKIQTSKVVFSAEVLTKYFIDSEGNKQITNGLLTYIEIYANTQTKDGVNLRDYVGYYAHTPEELPKISTIVERVKGMADTLSIFTDITKEKEYTGPVLFTSSASCQLFYQILGKGLSDVRKPLYEQEQMGEIIEEKTGFLSGKLNKSVLPEGFSVYDDPTISDWNKTPLIGSYSSDDQGIKAEKIELVKAGKLVNLPISRKPTKEIKKSNGHGRYFSGMVRSYISNLIVKSDKATEDFEKELINLCKEEGLDYGIVITELAPALPKTKEEMAEEFFSFFAGGKPIPPMLNPPFVVYKLYIDGKKEFIKGLKFEGITSSVLKDIVTVGKGLTVYNTLIRDRFGESYLPISIVAPSVIIEKMVLTSEEEKPKKHPFLIHPYFGK